MRAPPKYAKCAADRELTSVGVGHPRPGRIAGLTLSPTELHGIGTPMRFTPLAPASVLAFIMGCASTPPAPPPSVAPPPPPGAPVPQTGVAVVTSTKEPAPPPVAPVLAPAPEAPGDAAVDATDRSADDRALDAGRKPKELLSFCKVAAGTKVAELGAGGGYTAELLARTVGASGKVYGQNNKFFLERFAEKPWSERLKKPVNAGIVRVDREFDEPLPPELKGTLDTVLLVLLYHDTVWLKTDRVKMNANVLGSLKPGGHFCVVDHSAKPGSGTTVAEKLHRIDEKVVVDEVSKAGFVLVDQSPMLRHPSDTRDWNASPRQAAEKRGTSDRFVLRFQKPGG
jgi:predicted methyltransferase